MNLKFSLEIFILILLDVFNLAISCDFKPGSESLVKVGHDTKDFSTIWIQLPKNRGELFNCKDWESKKLWIRYKFENSKNIEKMATISGETNYTISGEPCQNVELGLRLTKRKEKWDQKLETIQTGPTSSVENFFLSNLTTDEAELKWEINDQECSKLRITLSDDDPIDLDESKRNWITKVKPCERESIQIQQVLNNQVLMAKTIKFDTFPDKSLFGVKQDESNIEYREDIVKLCPSVMSIQYKLNIVQKYFQDGEDSQPIEGTLGAKLQHVDLRDEVQYFTLEEIKRELISKEVFKPCKTYSVDISAEIESPEKFVTSVNLVQNLILQSDRRLSVHVGNDSKCDRTPRIYGDDTGDSDSAIDTKVSDNELGIPPSISSTTEVTLVDGVVMENDKTEPKHIEVASKKIHKLLQLDDIDDKIETTESTSKMSIEDEQPDTQTITQTEANDFSTSTDIITSTETTTLTDITTSTETTTSTEITSSTETTTHTEITSSTEKSEISISIETTASTEINETERIEESITEPSITDDSNDDDQTNAPETEAPNSEEPTASEIEASNTEETTTSELTIPHNGDDSNDYGNGVEPEDNDFSGNTETPVIEEVIQADSNAHLQSQPNISTMDSSPAVVIGSAVMGIILLIVILAVLIAIMYRKNREKSAAIIPIWEVSENKKAVDINLSNQIMDDMYPEKVVDGTTTPKQVERLSLIPLPVVQETTNEVVKYIFVGDANESKV